MKNNTLLLFALCAAYLLLGYTNNKPIDISTPVVETDPVPVMIQVNSQLEPFDINGMFPYVVLIDNIAYRFERDDVKEFLLKGKRYAPSEPRVRMLSSN